MEISYEKFNLGLFQAYNKDRRGLDVLGWMRWDEDSDSITSVDPGTDDIGPHSLTNRVRYRIQHAIPVSYLFPEPDGITVYDVAEIEGTLDLENFAAGPQLLDAKLVLVDPGNPSKKSSSSSERVFLVACRDDKIISLESKMGRGC